MSTSKDILDRIHLKMMMDEDVDKNGNFYLLVVAAQKMTEEIEDLQREVRNLKENKE